MTMNYFLTNESFYSEVSTVLNNLTFKSQYDAIELIENIDGANQVLVHDYSYCGDCILKCNVDSLDEYVFIELTNNFDGDWILGNLLTNATKEY